MSRTLFTSVGRLSRFRSLHLLVTALLALAFSSMTASVWADPSFVNANDPDLPSKARGIPKGGALNIHDLDLEAEGVVTLELERFSVFADDAELELVTENGSTSLNVPEVAYFRGWSNHDPDTVVMIAVSQDGKMRGVITSSNKAWLLESRPGASQGKANGLQNRKVDLESELADKSFSCGDEASLSGVSNTASRNANTDATNAAIPTNVQYTAHMIVDTDFEYLQQFAGDAAAALEHMGDVFAYSSGLYEREIGTNLLIIQARLFSTNHDPYVTTTGTAGCGDFGALDEVQAEWSGNNTQRTLVHLLSSKPGGGCAYHGGGSGVLCSQADGYGASMGMLVNDAGNGRPQFDIDNPQVLWDNMVVAHEIGHNFGSRHTHNYCNNAGIAEPVDNCVINGPNIGDSCYNADPAALPGPGSLSGGVAGAGNGTIMSYCHLRTGGMGNFAWTFGQYHPDGIAPWRVPDHMRVNVAASSSCMALEYDGPDLAVYKDCKPDDPALVEETGICTIVVENNGPTIALGVVTEDLFLSDGTFSFGAITATKGDITMPVDTCTSSPNPQNQSGDVSCDLGDLAAGHAVTIEIPVNAEESQNINDRVSVSSDSPDPDMTNNMAEDTLTFYEDADLAVTKDCKPDGDLLTGEEGTCTIIVTNFGPSTAENVHVVDTHISNKPFTIDGVSPAGPCGWAGDVVTCDFPSLAAQESETIVVTIFEDEPMDINDTVTVTSDTEDSNIDNNTASDGLHIIEDADLAVTKDCKPDGDLLAGDDGTCTIIVTNFGPSDAVNVQVVDTHISNVPFTIDNVSPAGPCGWAGDVVTCNYGLMPTGATETIVVTINEPEPMDVNDTVTVTSETDDSNIDNNMAEDGLHIVGVADLAIVKTALPDPDVVAGESINYTLEVTNNGPSTAVNVVVEDVLPAGTVIGSISTTAGTCDAGVPGDPAQPVRCALGSVPVGPPVQIDIVLDVLPDTTGILLNTATVSSDTQDLNNSNDQSSTSTNVLVVTDLQLEKFADKDPVNAGQELKYLVRLTNNGPSTATSVVLTDNLPPETSLDKYKVLGGADNCIHSASNPDEVTCTVGSLNPGEQFVMTLTVTVDPSTPFGTVLNNCAAATEDPPNDGAAVCIDTNVETSADLWIDKTGGFITQNPGKNVLYTLTVHNDSGCSGDDPQVCGDGGPSDAVNVVAVDVLPADPKKLVVTFVSEDCVYDDVSHTVSCTTPVLAAGDSVVHTIEATPRGNLRLIRNVASVSSDTNDPNAGNNDDYLDLVVGGGGQKGTGE